MTETARVDSKGRLTIPRALRNEIDVHPGDVVFMERDGQTLRLAKGANPLDALAEHALDEYRKGRTRKLSEIALELE